MALENWSGHCWHCGEKLTSHDYSREARCPACSKATHSCRNCSFYDPGRSNECSEPIADFVSDKERANFCDYFQPGNSFSADNDQTSAENLLSAAEDLFK